MAFLKYVQVMEANLPNFFSTQTLLASLTLNHSKWAIQSNFWFVFIQSLSLVPQLSYLTKAFCFPDLECLEHQHLSGVQEYSGFVLCSYFCQSFVDHRYSYSSHPQKSTIVFLSHCLSFAYPSVLLHLHCLTLLKMWEVVIYPSLSSNCYWVKPG